MKRGRIDITMYVCSDKMTRHGQAHVTEGYSIPWESEEGGRVRHA